MKVRASVKKMCEQCKVIRRKGVVRVICINPRVINSVRDKESLCYAACIRY